MKNTDVPVGMLGMYHMDDVNAAAIYKLQK